MPQEDGFLTLLSIQKGYKYTQLKWLWIGVAAMSGIGLALLSWFYMPQLAIPACIAGAALGAGLFFLFLKNLPKKPEGKA